MPAVDSEYELMRFTITESTTRGDLLALVGDLDNERQKLHNAYESLCDREDELESRVERMESRLTEAADLMAEQGKIHNTPSAKLQWIGGE